MVNRIVLSALLIAFSLTVFADDDNLRTYNIKNASGALSILKMTPVSELSVRLDFIESNAVVATYACAFDMHSTSIFSRDEDWQCKGADGKVIPVNFSAKEVESWHPLAEIGILKFGELTYAYSTGSF